MQVTKWCSWCWLWCSSVDSYQPSSLFWSCLQLKDVASQIRGEKVWLRWYKFIHILRVLVRLFSQQLTVTYVANNIQRSAVSSEGKARLDGRKRHIWRWPLIRPTFSWVTSERLGYWCPRCRHYRQRQQQLRMWLIFSTPELFEKFKAQIAQPQDTKDGHHFLVSATRLYHFQDIWYTSTLYIFVVSVYLVVSC
jgi:hypothetical protein